MAEGLRHPELDSVREAAGGEQLAVRIARSYPVDFEDALADVKNPEKDPAAQLVRLLVWYLALISGLKLPVGLQDTAFYGSTLRALVSVAKETLALSAY